MMLVDGSIDHDQTLFDRYTARGVLYPLKCAHDGKCIVVTLVQLRQLRIESNYSEVLSV
jgi:hypothetical protein